MMNKQNHTPITGTESYDLRLNLRDPPDTSQTPTWSGMTVESGGDSISFQDNQSTSTATPTSYITQKHLADLKRRLSERDKNILTSLRKYRFLLTGQIQRLYFIEKPTKRTNTIITNHALRKLREYGLIAQLERRVGGVRAGSSSLIWHLTSPGYRLLSIDSPDPKSRKRFEEPSQLFLEHTLAIAETAVQLSGISRTVNKLSLERLDPEPSCWRIFKSNGRTIYLKPDLFAITTYESYEDSWFIEMDLGSESPTQVVEKCKTYLHYYNTGIEQRENEVFPLVVWIVKDSKRKERLRQYIRESLSKAPKMFIVITPDQLGKTISQDIDREEIC